MNKWKIPPYAWYAYIVVYLAELSWGLFSDTFEVTVYSYIGAALNLPALLAVFGHARKIKMGTQKIWKAYFSIMCLLIFIGLAGAAAGIVSIGLGHWEVWIGPLVHLPILYGLYLYIHQNEDLWQE